jgi:2-methylcitrate dehydratase PrpD
MPTPITRDLGRFLAGVRYSDLPAEAVRVAKLAILDNIAVTITGRLEGGAPLLLEALDPADGEATVLFTARRAPPPDAALINGAAAHALEYDDVALRGHPSAAIVPAILAEAENLGASGERLIAAYVAAYETWAELVLRDPDPQHQRGWHVTGMIGPIAAAAGCAVLHGLPADKAAAALAIGASQGAGLMANNGSMTKQLHAGRAAQGGLLAARLAEKGFSAAADGLEHPYGWLSALSWAGKVDLESPVTAGSPWRIEQQGIALRRHAVCYVGHRLIDGMLDLVERTGIKAEDVTEVRGSLARPMASVLRYHRPSNGAEAKFSAEFDLAAALLCGRITPFNLDDSFVQSEAVQSLMDRVTLDLRDEANPLAPAQFDQVTVRTRDGAEYSSGPVKTVVGSPQRPFSAEDVRAKFTDCVAYGTRQAAEPGFIADFFERLSALEKLADVRELRAFAC